MENATTQSQEGLLEPVFPGSVTFDENILAPLQNNYLYKESKKCFTYNSAHLINNAALRKRYAAFCAEKREKGYSEQELEESFGFLLFDDVNEAKKVGETGLLAGQAKCTTLGDSSKGVYISKYSDCLDLKRWYDGKTGYIVLVKLTKGRVKEVTDNYTQNFTPPTPGFDCHVSEQLGAVTSTTSSFLAYERTQYYMYEHISGGSETESCPRQACPFAIVAFSYGATAATSGLEEKSQDKKVFRYKPWIGQLKIESAIYDVGLQSVSGAWFPTKLPKMVKIDHAIGVSELKRTLPREIFETCLVGEVCIDGRCFNLYDVVSSKAKNDLAQITKELKEKNLALVIPLNDSGFLILLHSSHLFSYEDAKSGKAAALQGMFIFPDSRAVPRDTKCALPKNTVSADVIQAIPALNYAETEMEKCPPDPQGSPNATLEKHLQNYATLIQPGLLDNPTREASTFPDQYDVPSGFTLIAPKWSQESGTRLKSYFEEPCGFTVPVVRALKLLSAERQQRSDEDDDVYYYISSPEEVPQPSADDVTEVTEQTETIGDGHSTSDQPTEQTQPVLQEGLETLRTEYPTSTVSPKLGDVPKENCVGTDAKKSQACNEGLSSKETPLQTSSTQTTISTKQGCTVVSEDLNNAHPEKTMVNKVDWRSLPRRRGRNRKMHWKTLQVKKEVLKELALPTSSLHLILPVNSNGPIKDPIKEKPESDCRTANHVIHSKGRRHKRRGVRRNLSGTRLEQASFESPVVSTSVPTETIHDQIKTMDSLNPTKRDWRSLPRRKRLWNADANLKRCLRSDALKTDNNDSLSSESSMDVLDKGLYRGPKRKMEGLTLKERYGLKTIITKCGRVFVPHGSDVASGDVDSSNKEESEGANENVKAEVISPVENKSTEMVKSGGESPSKVSVVSDGIDSSYSPSKDKPSVQLVLPITILGQHDKSKPSEMDMTEASTSNEVTCLQHTNKDHSITVQADETTSPEQPVSSLLKVSSPEKNKKKTKHVYSAISISKLKTVLRRGKRSKSPAPAGDEVCEPEPESKKGKSEVITDNIGNCKQLKDKTLQYVSDTTQNSSMSHGGQESMKTLHNESVPRSGLIHNGSLNFHTSAPFEIVKRVDEQLISSLIGEGVGRISSDGKGSTEKLTAGATLPSDALSLLADLALGASNSKAVADLEVKPGLETDAGVKGAGSPESVLHALLRCPSSRFNLPSRSPFPEGLLVTGELILEISKEHSYSQPTSLLSGLSGSCPPVCSPSGCVESLSLKTGPHLDLPVDATTPFCQKEGGKMGWKHQISPNGAVPSNSKTKTRTSRIFHDRRVFEENGLLQVDRNWSEKYDFKYDSKFTNDSLDKTIMRALHGNWNYEMEDTQEEMYLIFHMWIGLFYSKTTSRLFQLENNNPLPTCKGQKDVKVKRDGDPIQTSVSLLNVELNLKDHSAKLSDILDLSVKNDEPVNLHLVSKQSQDGDAVLSHGVASREMAPKHLSSDLSSSPKVTALMNHRSAVDIPVENVQSDNENDVEDDNENDIIADCSYTQLLEGNSAYSQLCEKASDMSISIGPRMSLSKVTNVSKNVTPTKPTSFKPKNVGVFHQVLCHIKPSAFSYCHGIVLGRKKFDESLKNKPGNGVFVQQKEEDVSKVAESDAVSVCDKTVEKNADESPVLIQKESVSEMKDSKDITDEDSEDDSLKIVEDEIFEKNVTSESSSSDAEFNPSPDQKDHTDECDGHVDKLKDNLSPEVKNETSNACKDLEPLLNPEDHANAVDASSCVVEENDTEEPVEERDETCKVEEKLQVCQSKSEEKTELDGSNSECKTSTTVVTHSDEFVVDNVDNVDMEISDEDSDENTTIDVYEPNIPTVKSFVLETFIQEDRDVESKVKSETETEKPEVCHVGANPEDDAQIETDVSCSVDACLLACQPMCVEEKTTIASNNDVMQSEKENVTLDQKIVIEEEALDMCEKDPENIESSQLEISHLDKDEESDVNENDRQSETLYSCEDKTQVMDTHQKCQSPKICASSPHTTTNSCDKTVIPQALKKTTEDEVNSTCSTPTQDEVSYDAEREEISKEVSDFKEGSNRDQHCTDDIDHDITVSPCSQVYSKMPFSDSIEETSSEEPGLKKTEYTSPMDLAVKDKSPSSSSEHPEILSPTSQQKDVEVNITESTPQNNSELSYRDYDVDEFHEYHNKYPSDKYCPWTNFKTDGADSHQYEDDYDDYYYYYPCDEDYGDVGYPVYNTSEVSQGSCEANIEMGFCQTKKSCKSSLDDASRSGSFKGQTKMSYTLQYATSTDSSDRLSHKRSRKVYSQEDLLSCTVDCSVRKTTSFETYQTKPTRTVTVNCLSQGRRNKQRFDWRRYFRREATSRELYDTDSVASNRFDVPPSSIVTILDQKGNRVTFDNSLTAKPSVDTHRITTEPEDSSSHCHGQQSKVDLTQSAVDLEYLIFSEQLNCIVKESKSSLGSTSRCRSSTDIAEFPMTVQFSNLNVLESPTDLSTEQTSLNDFKIKVELSDKIGASGRKPRRFCEVDSDGRMNDGKNISRQTEAIKRKWDQVGGGQQHVRKDAFDNLQDNLNFTVRREYNVKYRFYILVTSADTFFEETRNLLMMEGHVPVDPDEFDLGDNSQSPLLVILRNEDVAEHISATEPSLAENVICPQSPFVFHGKKVMQVPYLLELKKSSNVLFAGIDRPDDVVNFTHQELFADGGFIVCDEQALDKLTLDNMKKVAGILEELDKKGKWKWFLHYKDSRKLRESARSSQEASKKQRFIDCCQEAGIIEILPYHDCDVMSQGRPDYLYCLTHLQIQNASVRFPVFITDTSSDAFENNGILTMDIYTFSRMLSKDTCHVS